MSSPAATTLRLLGGDSNAGSGVALWYRALRLYTAGDEAGLAALNQYMRREMSQSHYAGAIGDLLGLYTLELLRAAARRKDWPRIALAVSVRPGLLEDSAYGAELCGLAQQAYLRLGLTLAVESTARRCLPRQRAAGQERIALFAIAQAQRSRADHAGALRTLRYLAGRDPLAAAVDAHFWAAFGEAQLYAGRFELGMSALRRALDEGDAEAKARARRALGDALTATGHHRVGLYLLAPELLRDDAARARAAHGKASRGVGAGSVSGGAQAEKAGGAATVAAGPPGAAPMGKSEKDIRATWERVARGLRVFEEEEARQR